MNTSLSDYEMKLVTDAGVLLTKNTIIQKVYELLGTIAADYKQVLQSAKLHLNEREAKISRGENYQGLPYLILDYPRLFDKVDVFAIRTFFWWGHFFSITLQLSGKYKEAYFINIEKAMNKHLFEGWFIGCASDPWQHHFKEDNYLPITTSQRNIPDHLSYIKIAKKIPLTKWDEVHSFLNENFTLLVQVLSASGTNAVK